MPDLTGRLKLIAGFVAYSCCFEYDMAIEKGLRLAKRHSDLRAKDNDNQVQITRQRAKVIFDCIEISVKEVKDSFPTTKLDDEAKLLLKNTKPQDECKYGKPYSYFPDLTMQTTTLNEKFHPIALLIIKETFVHYQTAIEEGKKEAIAKINQMDNVNLHVVLQELYKCFGKNCMAVYIDIDALLQKKEFQACFSQSYIGNPVTNGAESVSKNVNSSDQRSNWEAIREHQAYNEKRDKQSSNTEERNTMALMRNPETISVSCLFENGEESQSDTFNAHSHIEKPSMIPHIDLTLEEDEDDVVQCEGQQNYHETYSSKFQNLERNRKRTRESQFTGNYQEDSDSESEEEARARFQKRNFRENIATPSLVLTRADLGARDLTAPLMDFEEAVKKALNILHALKGTASVALQKILNVLSYDTIVEAMKAGMTIEAQKFVLCLVNGDQEMVHDLEKLAGEQEEVPEEHRVGIIIFLQEGKFNTYASSISDIESSYTYVSSQSAKGVIKTLSSLAVRDPTSLKLLRTNYGLGNDENTKFCLPLWSMNEAVEDLNLFNKREFFYGTFASPVDVKRAFFHFTRCLLIVICWTTQNPTRLNKLMRQAFPRSLPPLGLNDCLPLSATYRGKIPRKAPLSRSTDTQIQFSSLMQRETPLQIQKTFSNGLSKHAELDNGASSLIDLSSTSTASSSKSQRLYEDKVRALLREGIKSRLYYCGISRYLQGQIYLSKTKKATYHIPAYWKGKKTLKNGDSVIIKMRLGEKLTYTKDYLGVGASLEIIKGQCSYPIFIQSRNGKGAQFIQEIIKSRSSL